MDCGCSKLLDHGLHHGLFLSNQNYNLCCWHQNKVSWCYIEKWLYNWVNWRLLNSILKWTELICFKISGFIWCATWSARNQSIFHLPKWLCSAAFFQVLIVLWVYNFDVAVVWIAWNDKAEHCKLFEDNSAIPFNQPSSTLFKKSIC